MGKNPEISDDTIYAAVASRRAGFDNMAWQVPIISLTAQAFLFTIALGPDSRPYARLISASLAFLVSLLSMLLLARHRQADIVDAHWLADLEERRSRATTRMKVHGSVWRERRDATEIHRGVNWITRHRAFVVWEFGLLLFGLAGIAVVIATLVAPGLLEAPPSRG